MRRAVGVAVGLAAVTIAFLIPTAALATVPYKKYGTLSRTMSDYNPGPPKYLPPVGYQSMTWHYKGSFPALAKNEYVGFHGFYDGKRTNCWQYAFAGDMAQRRLTDPKMAAITAPAPSGGYTHAYCVGTWYGLAQVYKQGRNVAVPVLTIAEFSFTVNK